MAGPRLPEFRSQNPNILFNVNGEGDVRLRIGGSDIRVGGEDVAGESLFEDRFVAVCTHENILRLDRHPAHAPLEGYPLLQLERRSGEPQAPEWTDWFARFGMRESGLDRGYRYRSFRPLLEAARSGVGMALAPLSYCLPDLRMGVLHLAFADKSLPAAAPYRLAVRDRAEERPQLRRFLVWLRAEAADTQSQIASSPRPV